MPKREDDIASVSTQRPFLVVGHAQLLDSASPTSPAIYEQTGNIRRVEMTDSMCCIQLVSVILLCISSGRGMCCILLYVRKIAVTCHQRLSIYCWAAAAARSAMMMTWVICSFSFSYDLFEPFLFVLLSNTIHPHLQQYSSYSIF